MENNNHNATTERYYSQIINILVEFFLVFFICIYYIFH